MQSHPLCRVGLQRNSHVSSAVCDAERSNAKRSTARARDTCTTRAQSNSAHTTVDAQLCTHCTMRSRSALHDVLCAAVLFLSRVPPVLCVPRSRRFLVAFLHTADRMFSKDSSFQAARRLRRRLESCVKLARLVDWISLGFWLRMWRMSELIWNSPLYLRILAWDLSYLSVLLSFILLPLCPHLPLLSRFLLPLRLWSFRLRSSVGKATAKRVRSRKVEKGKAKRTAQMVEEVESGGEVLGNAGGSLVGQMVVWSSVPDGFSEGSQRSKGGSDSFDDFSLAAQSAETPHFHGLSQNLESCGVPARLKTSKLSAHQMPKILKAERSSNASSASRLGGSTMEAWEQASRESYSSLVSGGLLPEGFEGSFVKLAQKARPARKRIQERIATMSPMDLGQELRERQAANLRAEEMRKTATEQLIHASGRVPKKARTRLATMSLSGPTARQDAERAEKSRWLAHLATLLLNTQTPLQQRLVEKPAACNSMGLGLRSGTLRNRVHALRRYFCWLATTHQVPFPSVEEHMLDYLELEVQERCNRVALKVVHQSLVYLEEIAEISPSSPPHSPATLQQPPSRTLVPDQTRS